MRDEKAGFATGVLCPAGRLGSEDAPGAWGVTPLPMLLVCEFQSTSTQKLLGIATHKNRCPAQPNRHWAGDYKPKLGPVHTIQPVATGAHFFQIEE